MHGHGQRPGACGMARLALGAGLQGMSSPLATWPLAPGLITHKAGMSALWKKVMGLFLLLKPDRPALAQQAKAEYHPE